MATDADSDSCGGMNEKKSTLSPFTAVHVCRGFNPTTGADGQIKSVVGIATKWYHLPRQFQ
jgi:hypothetical protein